MDEIEEIKNLVKKKKALRTFWENHVYYNNWYFYKIPSFFWKLIFYKDLESYTEVKNNYELLERYFWEYFKIADTDIFKDKDNHYVIKQKKLDWDILSVRDIKKDSLLKDKFRKLMEINEKMWEEKNIFLDILWTDFIFNPFRIHNIIKNWDNLYLFDFWVLKKDSKNSVFRFFSNLFYHLQRLIIYKLYL